MIHADPTAIGLGPAPFFRRGTRYRGLSRGLRLLDNFERLHRSCERLEALVQDGDEDLKDHAIERLAGRMERLGRIRGELAFVLGEVS